MINVKMLEKCEICKGLAKINNVFVYEEHEETYFIKEYICDCGYITTYAEVINYTIK